jgi:alpha,alpha-trehalase
VADIQGGTTSEGIHTGAMAGSVDLVQRCFTGIETRSDTLRLDPCLPDPLERLRLQIRYRQHTLDLVIGQDSLSVRSEPGPERPIRLHVNGEDLDFAPGESRQFPLERDCEPARAGA